LPTILHESPFFDRPTTIQFQRRTMTILSNQIVVWVSIAPPAQAELPARAKRFPAILDTGCNHNFVIRQRHLIEWTESSTTSLSSLGLARVYGGKAPQFPATIWIHRNRRCSRDRLMDDRPARLEANMGIVVVSDSVSAENPRIPVLGLRAISWNGLRVIIDGPNRSVTIRRPRWIWPF
jgi:hypothetical protein